ncbi:MAG: DUF2207 domain-containing protein [Trueperaceae bacterium]|jgi:uncharacterized membrane protein|nr:DUF2207 domain-containing protein [Truepera sp.]HRN18975.1 DUF2207 domain-containing protein [Trueperaceae bacterium]HRQ09623.1 DUF2207 domain-containing protein [Trueperaceae bacterium]
MPRKRSYSPRLVLLCLALLAGSAAAQSYEWRDVVQKVTIGADDSVLVDDTRTLTTDGNFGEAFVCVHLEDGQKLTLLEGSGALGPGPEATAYQQPCADGTRGTEVVVRNATRVRERRVRFVYRLNGVLDYRSDVVQWYWQILEQDHPPVRGYSLSVTAPGPSPEPYDAYVHRFANPELPTVSLSEDRSRLSVAFDRIPEGDGVEIRYLMDPALFETKGTRPGMEEFLLDEAKVARVQTLLQVRRSPWWALIPAGLLLLTAPGAMGAYRRYGREPRIETMKYPFEPPSSLPPAAVTSIMSQRPNHSAMGPAFHATIMDLMRRGYGEFASSGKRLKDFAIDLKLEADSSTLLPFEENVLGYLKRAARPGSPDKLSGAELKAYSQRHASSFMAKWAPAVRSWLEATTGGPLTTEESRKAAKKWSGRMFLALLVGIALAFFVSGPARVWVIAFDIVIAIAALAASNAIISWRPDIAEEVYGWRGFKRTLTDYTRMKDAPPDFFKLWDVYYCYAAALGVAEQYLRTLGKAAPLAGVDERTLTSQAVWLSGGNVANLSSMSALSQSISSLSSALSSASASASSGGSSSGGGGGGGGGSSGGR